MKEKSDSPSVPYNFSRCFNDQCPQASKCLRYIAAQNETADYLYISIVSRLLSKFMWHGDLNSCLTEFPMKMRSVSEYKWSDTMEKRDIIGSIVENGGLCLKTKPTSDNYSAIKG